MCFICFDGSPLEDDVGGEGNKFDITMTQSICTPVCMFTCVCPCIEACLLRKKVLRSDMTRYTCCQSYYDGMCCGIIRAGSCREHKCPHLCLFIEACCCVGPSISASRSFIMSEYELKPDACDNRYVRFSNCVNLLAVCCDLIAICCNNNRFRELRALLRCFADCVFLSTLGCMASQACHELEKRDESVSAPAESTDRLESPVGLGRGYCPPIATAESGLVRSGRPDKASRKEYMATTVI
jgi:hypothetical protein